jgi:hypothetical protein
MEQTSSPERSGRVVSKESKESKEEQLFPKFDYYIDESDPDTVILRRQDGAFVAAFSARGATREAIVEAAKVDYGDLIEANASYLNLQEVNKNQQNQQRSA